MRDERDYAAMSVEELRVELVRVTKDLASWSNALAQAKMAQSNEFLAAYQQSPAKSVAERRMDAQVLSATEQNEVLDLEGQVAFHSAVRDCIVTLLERPA